LHRCGNANQGAGCFRAWRASALVTASRARIAEITTLIRKLESDLEVEFARRQLDGVISYVREIAARTEQYWCPIKHARRVVGVHDRYSKFADYGDAVSYQAELAALRKELNLQRESGA